MPAQGYRAWIRLKSHTQIQIKLCYSDEEKEYRLRTKPGREFRLLARDQVLSVVKQISDPKLMQSNL